MKDGNLGDNHGTGHGFVVGNTVQNTGTSATQAVGGKNIATIKFRTSTRGGDDYNIVAKVQAQPDLQDTSKTITVWRKFSVEVDAMMTDPPGGEYHPLPRGNAQKAVKRVFEEVFVELDIVEDQVIANLGPTGHEDNIKITNCGFPCWFIPDPSPSCYGNTCRTTNKDLHLCGVQNLNGHFGGTCVPSIHGMVVPQGVALKTAWIAAHELGRTLNAPTTVGGIMSQPGAPPELSVNGLDIGLDHFDGDSANYLRTNP